MNKRWAIFIALVLVVVFGFSSLDYFGKLVFEPKDPDLEPVYTCTDSDGGKDFDVWGYVEVCNQYGVCEYFPDSCCNNHPDICTTEMYCDVNNCGGDPDEYCDAEPNSYYGGTNCREGIATDESFCEPSTCNLFTGQWCDGSGIWVYKATADYNSEDYCGLIDSTSNLGSCTSGSCDYVARKQCYNGEWYSSSYCGDGFCGNDIYSQAYCFCDPNDAESSETDCTDGLDNDCDGLVDSGDDECEGSCFSGQTQICGDKAGVGICTAGTETCSESGIWGTCVDYYAGNETETNCTDLLDDDCDDFVDGLDTDCGGTSTMSGSCTPGETIDCGSNVGSCTAGTQYCTDSGYWSICYGSSYGATGDEECNGEDDDCDGEVDEGCSCVQGEVQICGTGVGLCEQGEQTCEAGVWGDCLGGVEPFTEVCTDGLDNDCDGKIDGDDENCGGGETPIVNPVINETEPIISNNSRNNSKVNDTNEIEDPVEPYERDTGDEGGSGWLLYLIIIIVILFLGGGAYLYFKSKKKKSVFSSVQRPASRPVQRPRSVQRPVQQSRPVRKGAVNPLDSRLEKSFKRSKDIFRK